MEPQKIIAQAREDISSFCINDCKAYCCRKGYLNLDEKEVELVVADMSSSWKKEHVKEVDGKFSVFLGNGCPQLGDDNKCKIHNNKPKVCTDYPLFYDKELKMSPRCLAVKENKFYGLIRELR